MAYTGSRITLAITDQVATLTFNNQAGSVNKFDQDTLQELREATDALKAAEGVQGLLVKSDKKDFIVGADIMEFGALFQDTEENLLGWMEQEMA